MCPHWWEVEWKRAWPPGVRRALPDGQRSRQRMPAGPLLILASKTACEERMYPLLRFYSEDKDHSTDCAGEQSCLLNTGMTKLEWFKGPHREDSRENPWVDAWPLSLNHTIAEKVAMESGTCFQGGVNTDT